jgi:CYTH domain-containing protein
LSSAARDEAEPEPVAPMTSPRYALLENERRFLVSDPPDLTLSTGLLIEDLYVTDSRLRLRRVTQDDGACTYKLCKKYESSDVVSGPIVNIYLSAQEYDRLTVLPGNGLRKRRYRIPGPGAIFGLDVFEGALAGLILYEVEAETRDLVMAVQPPAWAAPEVTGDPFFTGASLARATAAMVEAHLARRGAAAAP